MPKPLNEMDLSEVLEMLTPPQRESILSLARRLAKPNLATSGDKLDESRNPLPLDEKGTAPVLQSVMVKSRDVGAPKSGAKGPTPSSTVATTSKNALARCEVCKTMVWQNQMAQHLLKAHGHPKNTHGRRLCGKCHTIVDANLYDEHLREKHGTTSHSAPSSKTPIAPDRNQQKPDIAKGAGQSPSTSPKSAPTSTSWYIDGRTKAPAKLAASSAEPPKRVGEPGKSVKCAMCGKQIAEAEFEHHWAKVHKNRNLAQQTKERSKKKKTPRLIQGGLCNPR